MNGIHVIRLLYTINPNPSLNLIPDEVGAATIDAGLQAPSRACAWLAEHTWDTSPLAPVHNADFNVDFHRPHGCHLFDTIMEVFDSMKRGTYNVAVDCVETTVDVVRRFHARISIRCGAPHICCDEHRPLYTTPRFHARISILSLLLCIGLSVRIVPGACITCSLHTESPKHTMKVGHRYGEHVHEAAEEACNPYLVLSSSPVQ